MSSSSLHFAKKIDCAFLACDHLFTVTFREINNSFQQYASNVKIIFWCKKASLDDFYPYIRHFSNEKVAVLEATAW